MKALSIKEPWASLILSNMKTIETRTWYTNYRGQLLLCASKNPKGKLSGYAFATACLCACRRMTRADEKEAQCEIYENAYSWIFINIEPLRSLIPVKGQLGIFEVDI